MRCPECGTYNKEPDRCRICGHQVAVPVDTETTRSGRRVFLSSDANQSLYRPDEGQEDVIVGEAALPVTGQTMTSPSRGDLQDLSAAPQTAPDVTGDLDGRVISAEPLYMEPPNFDACRVLTRIIWMILLVASPFIILRAVLVSLGALPAVLAFIGLMFLLRYISPTNLFSLFCMSRALNPVARHQDVQVPVHYFRVRDAHDHSEVMVRIKGQYTRGSISTDDLVSLWGRWQGGVLVATRGYNHRTQGWVEIQKSYSWLGLILTVILLLAVVGFFYQPTRQVALKIHSLEANQ